jgi:putative ABC transport system substrate-binding protein
MQATSQTAFRIGALVPIGSIVQDGLRQSLRDLGHTEGGDIQIEWRDLGVPDSELRSVAKELVKSKVDVIVAFGSPAARAALSATKTIPIVFTSGNPVAGGFAESLSRPGANGTGVSVLSMEMYLKCLQYLHEIAPRTHRVAYILNNANPLSSQFGRESRAAAANLGIELSLLGAGNPRELDAALRKLTRSFTDALLVSGEIFFLAHRREIADAVRNAKLLACFPYREYHDEGVLISYGPSIGDMTGRVARYVDKVLKGAKAGELPIEQISKFDLIVDLRVARQLGIKVPQDLLLRADQVIR